MFPASVREGRIFSNDNDPIAIAPTDGGDVHGAAALLLVESLIHGLCETAGLRTDEAIGIVERAASVQANHAEAADDRATLLWRSHQLLQSIAASLKVDGPGEVNVD